MDRREFLKTTTLAAGAAMLGTGAQASVPQRMTVAAVGDLIPTRRMSGRRDDGFLGAVELLRGADCTWGNCETVIAEPEAVYPSFKEIDPYTLCEPWAAEELAFLGVDFVGTANNHIVDWGYEGLFATLDYLERAGIAHAGAGRDLAAAAGPGYYDSPAGRVAQVNCASTFRDYFAAGESHPYVKGRPGLNPLRLDAMLQVSPEVFRWMKDAFPKIIEIEGASLFQGMIDEFLAKLPPGTLPFNDMLLKEGDKVDILEQAKQEDVDRITAAIEVGRHNARLVIASLHAHEARYSLERNALFIEPFARATVDAGADVFLAAGPHVLRGIEIYQGKPIFYGLSNFVFHYEGMPLIPAASWKGVGLPKDSTDPSTYARTIPYYKHPQFWETIVPVITFEGGFDMGEDLLVAAESPRVVAIEIHPVTLGFGEPIWRRGTPELARGEAARAILEKVAKLSEPYGTRIEIRGDVGYVELG